MERNLAERISLVAELQASSGIESAESQANFIWFDLPEAVEEREIVKRPRRSAACSCAPARALGREGALRVTVGTQAENERFVEALGALVLRHSSGRARLREHEHPVPARRERAAARARASTWRSATSTCAAPEDREGSRRRAGVAGGHYHRARARC